MTRHPAHSSQRIDPPHGRSCSCHSCRPAAPDLAELYGELDAMIRRVVRRRFPEAPSDLADDAAAETWRIATEKRAMLGTVAPEDRGAYLAQVAKHAALALLTRGSGSYRDARLPEGFDAPSGAASAQDAAESAETVRTVLALPERPRRAVVARMLGLKRRELPAALGVTLRQSDRHSRQGSEMLVDALGER